MPSKKNKSKSKKKTGAIPSTPPPPQALIDSVYLAEGWEAVADLLCAWLEIPDLHTRHGLKQVHKNYDDTARKLEQLYDFAFATQNDRVLGGVIGIYTVMSADHILRNRVFSESDYLNKLLGVLDRPASRLVALESLAIVTHHGGFEVRSNIALTALPTLLDVLEADQDNLKAAGFIWTALSHSIASIVQNEEPPPAAQLRALQIPRLIRSALFYLRKPNIPRNLRDHVSEFLTGASQHGYKDFWANEDSINFFLACTRSQHIRRRADGLGGLLRATITPGVVEDIRYDFQKMMAQMRLRWPEVVNTALVKYGYEKTDTCLLAKGASGFLKAIQDLAQDRDRDFVKAGRRIGDLILATENSISQGGFQAPGARPGEFMDLGLGFTWFHDALPVCARALRATGNAKDLDTADILELKYLMVVARREEGCDIARRAIERNPNIGFFYYALSVGGGDKLEALRDAKKGLKCPNLTPYVKYGLLWRAAEVATDTALRRIEDSHENEDRLQEGYAFAVSAWEDTRTYIQGAPPDGRSMLNVCYLHTVMEVLLHGHEQTPDLPKLAPTKHALLVAEGAARHLGRPVSEVMMRIATKTIFERLEKATKDWGGVIAEFDSKQSGAEDSRLDEVKVEDSMTRWLERFDHTDLDNRGRPIHQHSDHNAKVDLGKVDLYRCTWCGNPSAILRKCRGCGKTRYCDAACQKQHWKSHRKFCARMHEQEGNS